ncbi:MAG: hypothetical protein HFJ14_10345, partial [Clostridium sp.]|nr:hypothetical protein [Clostridium sp.]
KKRKNKIRKGKRKGRRKGKRKGRMEKRIDNLYADFLNYKHILESVEVIIL